MNKRVTSKFQKNVKGSKKRSAFKKPRGRGFFSALLVLFSVCTAYPTVSETWQLNNNLSASTVLNGVTIGWTGTPGDKDYDNGGFDRDPYWTDPFNGPFGGADSLQIAFAPFGTNRTITVTFSRPVDNPVLHVGRMGDQERKEFSTPVFRLSSFLAESPDVTISRLSGNPAFQVNATAKSFQRTPAKKLKGNACKDRVNEGTGCGSIQFSGTGITSLTFDVTWDGADNGRNGDKMEIGWSLGTSVIVKKESVGTTGNYEFSGTNGIGSFGLNTALSNPAASARFPIPDSTRDITITEAAVPGMVLNAVACTDPAGNAVPSSFSGLTATLAAAEFSIVNQLITCKFTNAPAPPPVVDLVKDCPLPANCLSSPQLAGTDLTYSIQFTNSGGQSAAGLMIVDVVPANTDYEIGSAAANPGTTGLTFAVEYSDDYDPGNPGAATWNYTPVSAAGGAPDGYDRLAKAIRWRVTSGSLSNTAPDNTADLSFRVRIR